MPAGEKRRRKGFAPPKSATQVPYTRTTSKENNAAEYVGVLVRVVAVERLRLGVGVFTEQRDALGQAVVDAEHTGLVRLDQIAVVRAQCLFVGGQFQPRLAIARSEFDLVELVGLLRIAAVRI